jgi:hypothetical protein
MEFLPRRFPRGIIPSWFPIEKTFIRKWMAGSAGALQDSIAREQAAVECADQDRGRMQPHPTSATH